MEIDRAQLEKDWDEFEEWLEKTATTVDLSLDLSHWDECRLASMYGNMVRKGEAYLKEHAQDPEKSDEFLNIEFDVECLKTAIVIDDDELIEEVMTDTLINNLK